MVSDQRFLVVDFQLNVLGSFEAKVLRGSFYWYADYLLEAFSG